MEKIFTGVTCKQSRDNVWILTVEVCPFCGEKHTHGGGIGSKPLLGSRSSHCAESSHSYTLVKIKSSQW